LIYPDIKNNEMRKAINRIKYRCNKEVENKNLINDIVIIVDKQEKVWGHIERKFNEYGFRCIRGHLKTGDYSFYYQGEDFSDRFSIERKNSIEELIASMLAPRFEREIRRSKLIDFYDDNNRLKTKINDDFYFEIMIESGTLEDILSGNHRINVDSQRMFEMLQSRKTEYNLVINFIGNKNNSANWILSTIKYYIKNKIRNELAIENKIFC